MQAFLIWKRQGFLSPSQTTTNSHLLRLYMNDYAETQKKAHCKNVVRSFFVNNDSPSDSRVLCDQIDFI